MIEIKSETLRTDTMMAMEFGRIESTLEAVENWFRVVWKQNWMRKSFVSWEEEFEMLAIILGIDIDDIEEDDDANT